MAKYKDLIKSISKQELEDYYKDHLPSETCEKFNIESPYLLKQILKVFDIPVHTPAENTRIQFDRMDSEARAERGKKISSSNMGRTFSPETIEKIRQGNIGKPGKINSGSFKPGHIPWNKGTKGLYSWSDGQAEKVYQTKLKNGTLGNFKTKIESQIEAELINKYGAEHVHYQYRDNERYPFNCDFYIDSEDLFIEVNAWWHHGPHPYDPNSIEDEDILNDLRWQAEHHPNSKQYKEAIRIWTERDPLKRSYAEKYNLNYITIYS